MYTKLPVMTKFLSFRLNISFTLVRPSSSATAGDAGEGKRMPDVKEKARGLDSKGDEVTRIAETTRFGLLKNVESMAGVETICKRLKRRKQKGDSSVLW